jgi:hypothetical protein
MVASVAATEEPNGRPLSLVWKLLHGNEERVQIRPLDPLGLRAEILVDWHPRAVYPGSDLPSSRVDVIVPPADWTDTYHYDDRGVRYVREQAGPEAMPVLRQEPVESP